MHGGKNRVIALGAKPRLLSEGTPGLLKFSLASSESPRSASGGAVLQVPGDTHHFLQPGWGALSTASFPLGSCWDAPRAQAGAAQPAAATMRSPASVRRPTPLPSIRKGPEAAARGAISSIGPHVVAFAPSFQGVST